MANDLVATLVMDTANYQAGIQSAINYNSRFAKSSEQLAAQLDAAQRTIDSAKSATPGSKSFTQAMFVEEKNAAAAREAAAASTRFLAAEMKNEVLQSQRLAASLEMTRANTAKLQSSNQQLAASLASSEHRAASGRAVFESLMGSILRDRQATLANAEAKTRLHAAMASGQITASEYQQAMAQAASAQIAIASGTGRTQAAIQQLVFAIDDASISFSNGGLSGAIRGASNNLTMMAALLGGPWALAAAVAVSAAVQLYLAFNKTSDSAEKAGDAASKMSDQLSRQNSIIKERVSLQQELDKLTEGGTASEAKSSVEDAKKQLEMINAQRESLTAKREERQNFLHGTKDRSWMQYFGSYAETRGYSGKARSSELMDYRKKFAEELVPINEKLKELDDERAAAAKRYYALQEAQLKLKEKEREESQRIVKENLQSAMEAFRAQAQERDKQRKQSADAAAQRAMDLKTELAAASDSTGKTGQQQRISAEYKSRLDQINSSQFSLEEKRKLREQAAQAGTNALKGLENSQPNHGPSAIAKGSQQVFEIQRQAMLRQTQPEKKSEMFLQQLNEGMKQLNATSKEQKKLAERYYKDAPYEAGGF